MDDRDKLIPHIKSATVAPYVLITLHDADNDGRIDSVNISGGNGVSSTSRLLAALDAARDSLIEHMNEHGD